MSIIQATRSVDNITNIDTYKLNTTSIGEDIVIHHPDPALGRYSIETWKTVRKIGQGGFGSVWLQEEEDTGVLRAVKKIYLEKSRNFPYSRELNALIKVWNHRELFVQFLGWYEKTDFVFVTMEYLENGDLEKYLKSSRLKAKSEAKEIATQLLEGLKVLHENEICHRDLKPNNILIACYSPIQVKLADFGSSKSTINTSLRTSCGTSGYKAPELLGLLPSKKRYDNSLDIWSLGCVIHEILTSELPFLRKSEDTDSSANSSITIRDPEPACSTPEVDVDIGILMSFCEGKIHFPEDVLLLAGVSVVGINFLGGLLAANPASRISASEALQSRDTWFFEMREELHQEDSPYILKEQFYSLGIVLSSSVINSLITQCKMRRGFDVKCTDLGSIPFLTNVIYEAIKRGYNLIIEMLLPLLLPGVDVCIYVDAVVKCGSIKTMISVLRGASLVNTKKFCQMAFYLAAGLGYPAVVMLLLSWDQLDVNSKTEDGETALHLAAASGRDEVVALLLERVDVDSEMENGGTAPHAAGLGRLEVVALLLDRGADMESKTENGETALHLVAESGYPKVVALLLDRGACMESKTKDGETALHLAAGSGNLEVVVLLLDRGAGMESKARGGATALHLAAGSGHLEVVVLLLDRGAGMESKAGGGATALHLAAGSGHLEVVVLLLDKGAGIESRAGGETTALHLAAGLGHLEVVALLLDKGAGIESRAGGETTALHLAAGLGHLEVVALLLDRGANMESKTEDGETPLHLAAGSGYPKVVALLLDRGANKESIFGFFETALDLAAESGHLEVVALLLDRGACIESTSKIGDGTIALHLAAGSGHPKVAALLLDRGVDMESTFGFSETALHLAAGSGHFEVVALLLDRGADIESRTFKFSKTALHLAAGLGHLEVVALLLDRGANMEPKTGDGETALHLAAGSGQLEVVALLLDRGADMESRTFESSKTPLHPAAEFGRLEVVALLLDKGASMESKTKNGETALLLAVRYRHSEVALLLRNRGADLPLIVSHASPREKRRRVS